MTKQVLEAFATEIRENLHETQRQDAADLVITIASRFNPRFDRDKFLKACGLKFVIRATKYSLDLIQVS